MPSIECVAGRGIRGDRFFDYKENYKGHITFSALEVFEQLCRALKVQNCSRASLPGLAKGMGRAVKEFNSARDEIEKGMSQTVSSAVAQTRIEDRTAAAPDSVV